MFSRIFSAKYYWILTTCLLFTSLANGQIEIKGQITDAKTNEPLAFVAVVVNNTSKGSTSDIDGNYTLFINADNQVISFRYVGYKTLEIGVNDLKNFPDVRLELDTKVLQEVTVLAGENPAHPIIRKLVANKKKLNPSNMDSYSFESYNKFQIGSDIIPEIDEDDSVEFNMRNYMQDSHLFQMESVTKREYERPNNLKETILANRISGIKTLQFATVATTFQGLGFYDDYVSIMNIDFLNPISKGSFDNYYFELTDSLIQEGRKSYTITFEPRKKSFNGFKGVLQVDSAENALRTVSAETVGFSELHNTILQGQSQFGNKSPKDRYTLDNYLTVNFKLQQNYTRVEETVWFPDQLKADFFLSEYHRKGSPSFPVMAISRSYLKNISISPDLSNTKFSRTVQRFDPLSKERDDEFWDSYRADNLTFKEEETYNYLDSLMEVEKVDRILNIFSGLPEKKIYFGLIDLNFNKAIDINQYEGFRLGIGLSTSDKISKHFEIGGYYAYGFKDKADKYGGYLDIHVLDEGKFDLFVNYSNDIHQFARVNAYEYQPIIFDTDNFYSFFNDRAYTAETYEAGVRFYWLKFLDTQLSLKKQSVTIEDEYGFLTRNLEGDQAISRFDLTEVSLKMGYNHGVYQVEALKGFFRTQRSKWYLGGEITRGLSNTLDGQFEYNKFGITFHKQFKTRNFGHPSFLVEAGYVDEAIPATHLFSLRGTGDERVDVGNSFRTMGINEFVANRFVNIFYAHKLTQFTIDPKYSEPQIYLQGAMAYGEIEDLERHLGNTFTGLNGRYLEAGILVRRILKFRGMEFGGGVYNRMGKYAFNDTRDNLFFKLDFTFDLGE